MEVPFSKIETTGGETNFGGRLPYSTGGSQGRDDLKFLLFFGIGSQSLVYQNKTSHLGSLLTIQILIPSLFPFERIWNGVQ